MGIDRKEITDSTSPEKRTTIPAETPLSLESAYGSVKASANPEDFDKISRIAKDEKAEKTIRELNE